MKNAIALLAGTFFGFALAISGMTDPNKVLGFLDITGSWVPDLAFVMGSAVIVALIGFQLILKKNSPLLDRQFHWPTKTQIDKPLIIGASCFGIGWGIYGYCPGPALASLVYLDFKSVAFLLAMITGMFAANYLRAPL